MKSKLVVSLFIVAAVAAATAAQNLTPQQTVSAFYRFSNARSSNFNSRHVESRKPWYTPALYQAMLDQLKEDAAYAKTNPDDKPYFGDGLTFRPLDEPCVTNGRSYKRIQRIGRTEIIRSKALVDVSFGYPAGCKDGGEPIIYTVNLKKIGGKWLIDDWTFGEGPSLVTDMKTVNN